MSDSATISGTFPHVARSECGRASAPTRARDRGGADAVGDAGQGQNVDDLGADAARQFLGEVARDQGLLATERGQRPLGVLCSDQQQHRQPHGGHPPVGRAVQVVDVAFVEGHTGVGGQEADLLPREGELDAAYLGEPTGEPVAVQRQYRDVS